jgi:hypothetical protein
MFTIDILLSLDYTLAVFMRRTVGHARSKRPLRPQDSFAYAGGEIAVRQLPVPNPASAPALPPHLMAVPEPPRKQHPILPIPQIEERQAPMNNPTPSIPHATESVALLPEQIQPAQDIKSPEPTPSAQQLGEIRPPRQRKRRASSVPHRRAPGLPEQKKALIKAARPTRIPIGDTSLNHHEAHCTICNHPARETIEQGFLHWQRSSALAREFRLGDRRVVYRHALVLGLYEIRAARSRRALEFIMEQAESVPATADTVIRAVRAHSCLGEDGRWTEPSKRVHITHEYADPTRIGIPSGAARPRDLAVDKPSVEFLGKEVHPPAL